ncbi:MAG: GNAT family N-acetyltransferase [Rikenellaceae bacterium]
MKYNRINSADSRYFKDAWLIYISSFPRNEVRDMGNQILILPKDNYNFIAIERDEVVVGIIGYWLFDSYIYVEHLATSERVRGAGVGGVVLDYLKSFQKPILLEIEPPVDDLTTRRKGFYERAGFVINPYLHTHSPYHIDSGRVKMNIMSYPRMFTKAEYDAFCRSQQEIMPRLEL